jgi:Uma2 family endonuclease
MDVALGPHTWEEFVALDEDDPRELIDGELVEVEVPTEAHEHAVAKLVYYLSAWADSREGARVFASGYKVRIAPKRGVMPDVQLFLPSNPRRSGNEQGLAKGRPDVAIEVVSPSSRRYDRVVKLRYYASIGVPEYWIVDPEARTLERLALGQAGYVIADVAAENDVFRSPVLDGLEIPLSKLWVKA